MIQQNCFDLCTITLKWVVWHSSMFWLACENSLLSSYFSAISCQTRCTKMHQARHSSTDGLKMHLKCAEIDSCFFHFTIFEQKAKQKKPIQKKCSWTWGKMASMEGFSFNFLPVLLNQSFFKVNFYCYYWYYFSHEKCVHFFMLFQSNFWGPLLFFMHRHAAFATPECMLSYRAYLYEWNENWNGHSLK